MIEAADRTAPSSGCGSLHGWQDEWQEEIGSSVSYDEFHISGMRVNGTSSRGLFFPIRERRFRQYSRVREFAYRINKVREVQEHPEGDPCRALYAMGVIDEAATY